MFVEFAEKFYFLIAKIPFDFLVWFIWGSYLAIFLTVFLFTVIVPAMRGVSKRPFLSLTNAYAAVNLAVYLLKCDIAQSLLITALFWVIGYILYGVLCVFSREKAPKRSKERQTVIAAFPAANAPVPPKTVRPEIPAAKNNVRLEHAVAVTDTLLTKNLGKTDRQELEKLKSTLAVLQLKGTLSPAEADILNENFNTLLKLMAKYNV